MMMLLKEKDEELFVQKNKPESLENKNEEIKCLVETY